MVLLHKTIGKKLFKRLSYFVECVAFISFQHIVVAYFSLTTCVACVNQNAAALFRNEISSLTLQLSESRREADEYYRGGIQNNMRAMELSEKVSRLTVGMAADTPWLTDHVQVSLVQPNRSRAIWYFML